MKTKTCKTWMLVGFCFMVGCTAPKEIYHWGEYQELLYQMSVSPGIADPTQQIETLTSDIQMAESLGKPVPPGVYAHLGMMYASNGDIPQARAAFATEKSLYPESAVLIDGMMERSIEINKEQK